MGFGILDSLKLIYVFDIVDIVVGDLLVSFGLGGCFFKGYLVGVVIIVEYDFG